MVPTILVLDQNSTVQRMMKLTFKEESVQVNTVKPSEDAFAVIDAHPPDIIFTENARKVVAFLKSRASLPRIPVVQLKGAFDSTATADEEAADAVLAKPLQPDAMVACVRQLLQSRTAAAPAVEPLAPAGDRLPEELDLEQYFDELEVAFNEADGSSSRLDSELWDTASSPAVDFGQKRSTVSHAEPNRPRLDRQASYEPVVTNELVDQIAQRVMDRLGERIVRSTATEVVSKLSKWLLVNELEKGKSAL